MYSIKDVANNLGFTEDQVRNRLDQLSTVLDEYIKRGKRNKILITSTGFQIFERSKELEDQGMALRDIPKTLDQELSSDSHSNGQGNGKMTLGQGEAKEYERELIREKDRRIENLQSQVRYLQNKLDERDKQIQQLLPAGKSNSSNGGITLLEALKSWWKS